jgi:hypothetical protein
MRRAAGQVDQPGSNESGQFSREDSSQYNSGESGGLHHQSRKESFYQRYQHQNYNHQIEPI